MIKVRCLGGDKGDDDDDEASASLLEGGSGKARGTSTGWRCK